MGHLRQLSRQACGNKGFSTIEYSLYFLVEFVQVRDLRDAVEVKLGEFGQSVLVAQYELLHARYGRTCQSHDEVATSHCWAITDFP